MKKLFALLIVAASLAAFTASAQVTTKSVGTFTGGTNAIAATTTNTYAASIATAGVTVDKAGYISIGTQFKAMAANSGNVVLTFVPTDSSTNGSTIASEAITVTIAANGTTQVNSVTNVFIGGTPTLLLKSAGNTGASAITNLLIRVNYKTGI